jgi:phosphoenolpyruvate phosphomutase
MGAHNGLGARLIERYRFDAIWAGGLEVSTAYGLPDANILTMTENLEAARAMNDATRLPVVCDCDTGYGNASNVKHMVRRYEAAGLAAAVIEDKHFPKLNSFIHGRQELVSIEEFAGKMQAAKEAQRGPDFMVFARVEALIAGFGLEEALRRAHAYVDAGADGIAIHSKAPQPNEVFAFARRWARRAPLVAIPTTYFQVTAAELERAGFSMVIYANQGLRASIRALQGVFEEIDRSGTTAGVEARIAPMKEVFDLQGMSQMREDEKKFLSQRKTQGVIPAARNHQFQADLKPLLNDRPLCMVDIAGKTLLDRQIALLQSVGAEEVLVVGGHLYEKIKADGAKLLYNPDYRDRGCAHSILCAGERLTRDTLIVYSDILFDQKILDRLLESPHDITLVIDRAYQTLPPRDKQLDLVRVEGSPRGPQASRDLNLGVFKKIGRIGRQIPREEADHEFIGIAYLREAGLRKLKSCWEEALESFRGRPFYEAPSVEQADFTDLILYLLDQGVPIFGMEIEHGWSEIHSLDDYARVCSHFQAPQALTAL